MVLGYRAGASTYGFSRTMILILLKVFPRALRRRATSAPQPLAPSVIAGALLDTAIRFPLSLVACSPLTRSDFFYIGLLYCMLLYHHPSISHHLAYH